MTQHHIVTLTIDKYRHITSESTNTIEGALTDKLDDIVVKGNTVKLEVYEKNNHTKHLATIAVTNDPCTDTLLLHDEFTHEPYGEMDYRIDNT